MSALDGYRELVVAIRADDATRRLLEAIAAAWLDAEGGIPSEAEARRWSPVCDAALALAAGTAGTP